MNRVSTKVHGRMAFSMATVSILQHNSTHLCRPRSLHEGRQPRSRRDESGFMGWRRDCNLHRRREGWASGNPLQWMVRFCWNVADKRYDAKVIQVWCKWQDIRETGTLDRIAKVWWRRRWREQGRRRKEVRRCSWSLGKMKLRNFSFFLI